MALDKGDFTEGHELDRKWRVPKEMIGRRLTQAEAKRLLARPCTHKSGLMMNGQSMCEPNEQHSRDATIIAHLVSLYFANPGLGA
jgi:hypothetical protein